MNRHPTSEISPPDSQMNLSEDPAIARQELMEAPRRAMRQQHQSFAGSAMGVGSIEWDDPGVFDVTEASRLRANLEPIEEAHGEADDEFRTEAEIRDRDPGDAAGSLSPDQPSTITFADDGAPAPNVLGAEGDQPAR